MFVSLAVFEGVPLVLNLGQGGSGCLGLSFGRGSDFCNLGAGEGGKDGLHDRVLTCFGFCQKAVGVALKSGEEIYAKGQAPEGGPDAAGAAGAGGADDVVDADFEEVKDDKKRAQN